jgi:hypothetical protein
MTPREGHITNIMIGRKRTGKSTELAKSAQKYPANKRVLILDVNGSPAYNNIPAIKPSQMPLWKPPFVGVFRIEGTPTLETLAIIAKHFRNGLLVFEDCTKYIPPTVPPEIKEFLVDNRMMGVDLIFTFHSWNRVPRFFWEMSTHVTIKKTQDSIDTPRNREVVPNYDKVLAAARRVAADPNEYCSITVETLI